MKGYNQTYINEQREIITSFVNEPCNRCESTAITSSVESIDETMENAIEHLVNILQTRSTAYDASVYGSILSMIVVSYIL
jgi:heterodisulfide reductase subunit B